MTASVTDIRAARHSWDRQPRRDDPTRSVYTCRRDTCGLKKRHELVDGDWIWVWLWPNGVEGQGRQQPSCGAVPAVGSVGGSEPASEPPTPTVQVAIAATDVLPHCTRCVPPCRRTGHPTLGGPTCDEGRAVVAAKRAAHLRELRDATSGMGVPTWRGGAA